MKLISTSKAAEISNRSESTIIRWCKSGKVKHRVTGIDRHYMILESSLLAHLSGTKAPLTGGWILLLVASEKYDMAASTIRKMCTVGEIDKKKVKGRVYVKEEQVKRIAATYDPQQARVNNGKRTAAKCSKKRQPQTENSQYPPATPRQIEHDHTLAWIENMVRVKA